MVFSIKRAAACALVFSLAVPAVAAAQDSASFFKVGTASVTYGPYVRFGLGAANTRPSDEHWLPPGYPSDPRIDFNLSNDTTGFGEIAFGYDWMNGFRGDVSFLTTGAAHTTGPHTTSGDHADITAASVSTTAVMGNLYYSPFEQMGVNSRLHPFVVAGLGYANNKVSDWTRTNPASDTENRTFSGDTHGDFAYSLGIGMAYQLTPPGKHPAILEMSYRYYSFGTAKGGSTPVTGGDEPVAPLSFENDAHVLSISLRIPLQRL
ncbi:hypothetical protein BMI86_00210 [Thioclava sp. DLFJ5-1]|uniref:outer membrane protein n=1 Tax=Thioclava sp. DLFJ5-1 TaxID=1915314 RepID=UPI000998147E|nr:outer membrane beta-barrel protein [Thioclava sp. DLFJ5-1]OOY21056.1 hypothetical protein BMI86_00210 [Thioclava sp. DLFJ5-1]